MNDSRDNSDKDEVYPWSHVDASRRSVRLQRQHPVSEGQQCYLAMAKACPACGLSADQLTWFYFESPKQTWQWLCGRAGWMTICEACHVQVNFFEEVIS
jgi:hypothetical protein